MRSLRTETPYSVATFGTNRFFLRRLSVTIRAPESNECSFNRHCALNPGNPYKSFMCKFLSINDTLAFINKRVKFSKSFCRLKKAIFYVQQSQKTHIVLVEKFDSDCCVDVDINEIQQAIINLIINAIESMPNKGGKLEITACKFSDFAEISFIDNGIGIRKENLDKIFEPFFTTKKNVRLSNNKVNIGLGLAISKTIVEKYGGKITVESEHKKGAKFTIKLPLKKMSFLESMVSPNKNIPRYKKY